MKLKTSVRLADPAREITLIVQTEDQPRVEGKYIVGRSLVDSARLAVIVDTGAAFHRDIAVKHRLRPLGGGWIVIDGLRKQIWLSGRSTQFGMEPDRHLTLAVLAKAFPDYRVERED